MKFGNLFVILWLFKSNVDGNAFPNYKHYSVHTKNAYENLAVKNFYLDGIELLQKDYDFSKNINYAVSAEAEPAFADFFTRNNIEHKKISDDYFLKSRKKIRALSFQDTRNISNEGNFNFGHYFTYEEISSYMNYLNSSYKDFVDIKTIGKTSENRNIYGLFISEKGKLRTKIQKPPIKKRKPILFFDAGIHAREWFASTFGLYIVNQFVENATIRNAYLPYIDIAIVPFANPDGYTYSRTTDPFWRKNRSIQKECIGVDLNRNFDIKWGYTDRKSDLQCHSSTYPGPKAFSEKETQAIRDFALSFRKNSIHLYAGLHTYGQYLLYSYGYTLEAPSDVDDLDRCARFVNSYLDNKYSVGSASVILPPASGGGSDDYFKDVVKAKYSFTMELTVDWDFHPPESAIEDEALLAIRGIYGFADFIKYDLKKKSL